MVTDNEIGHAEDCNQEGSGDCSPTTAVPGDAERYARAVQGSPSYRDLGRVTGAHSKLGVGDPGPAIIHRLSSCSTMRYLSPTAAPFHPSLLVDEPQPVEVEVDQPQLVEVEVDQPQPVEVEVEDVVMVPLVGQPVEVRVEEVLAMVPVDQAAEVVVEDVQQLGNGGQPRRTARLRFKLNRNNL